MIPDWAPNIHPLIVHLPIGILFVAVLVDLAGAALRRMPGVHLAAVMLYALGALGVVAAYISGNQAAAVVAVPTEAIATLTDHQDWALRTLWFFAIYAGVRIGVLIFVRDARPLITLPLALLALGGLYLVWQTSEYGGKLVFRHGVGVERADRLAEELERLGADELVAEASPRVDEDGSWTWRIAEGAEHALDDAFEWIEGSPDDVEASVIETERGRALALELRGGPVFFVTGSPIESVQIETEANLDEFDGTFTLAHNVVDEQTYHYVRFEEAEGVQGRLVGGRDEVLARGSFDADGWVTFQASGDRGHFYGYAGNRMVGHGHSPHADAGRAGIRLEGQGRVLIERIEVNRLR